MLGWQIRNQKTVNKALRIISFVPFTRMVALTGSLAEGRATEASDIDLFIQVKKGTIWSTRFFVTLFLQFLGLRRTDSNIKGKICLNWFATFNAPEQQIGRVYKILWPPNTKYESAKSSLLELRSLRIAQATLRPPSWRTNTKLIIEFLISLLLLWWLEKLLKKYQIARIERDKRTHQIGSQVRYSDTELGFHPVKLY